MNKIPGLDLLRAVAVLLVMLLHADVFVITTRMGWAGVDLFFVLSGFLVSGLLFKEYQATGKVRPGRFLLRRGFKIYPLFYFVLLLHIIYYAWKQVPLSTGQILSELFFFQNYRPGIIGISWSLAVEEHFYILLVLAAFIGYKIGKLNKRTFIPVICILLFILCLALRLYTTEKKGVVNVFVNDFPTHLRIDALAFGVLLSYHYHFYRLEFLKFFTNYRLILLFVVVILLTPVFVLERGYFIVTYNYTLLYLGFGVLMSIIIALSPQLEQLSRSKGVFAFLFRSLSTLGTFSYAIYLCHFIVGPIASNFVHKVLINEKFLWSHLIVYLCSTILAGVVLTIVIERPFLALRDRIFPQPGRISPR